MGTLERGKNVGQKVGLKVGQKVTILSPKSIDFGSLFLQGGMVSSHTAFLGDFARRVGCPLAWSVAPGPGTVRASNFFIFFGFF